MKPDLNNIFLSSSCLSLQDMKDYISGNLSDDGMRRIEIHIADCQMCNDELEGLSNMKDINKLDEVTSSINAEIDNLINKQDSLRGNKFNLKRVLSIAAAVALLITTGYVINYFYNSNDTNLADMQESEELIMQNEKSSEVFINESDTLNKINNTDQIFEESAVSKSIDESEKRKKADVKAITDDSEQVVDEFEVSLDEDDLMSEEITELKKDKVFSDLKKKETVKEGEAGEKIESIKTVIADNEPAVASKDKNKNISLGRVRGNQIRKKTAPVNSEKIKSIKSSAELSYNEKVYDEAIEGFDDYLEYKPNDYEIIFKKGKSYYFSKKFPEALSEFNKIIKSPSTTLKVDAEWYKSMCLIRIGKKTDAKNLLEKIVSEKGKYKDKAAEVLKQLND